MKTMKNRPRPESDTVTLRHPQAADCTEFIGRTLASEQLHSDLVSPPGDEKAFFEYVARNGSDADECFLIIEIASGCIAGVVNLSQIVLKGFCSAYLGFYLFNGFTGRGLMTSAIKTILKHSFTTTGLHRLEANIQPGNDSSIRLVTRCGFQKEGYSRKYLYIAGEWRDHERWAIIREDWEARINR